jgi:hypothetical protein
MKPKVSVVIPFYNAKPWIEESISSTLRSGDNVDLEIVLVDDASDDGSSLVAERIVQKLDASAARLIRNESNLGVAASLNRGIDAATGDYIARMDADDICNNGRFERQLNFLESSGCDACGSWFVEFGAGFPRRVRWPHTEAAVRTSMLFQNSILHPSLLAKRCVFDRFRYRSEFELVEDYDLFVRALEVYRLANVPLELLKYRRHAGQATSAKRTTMEAVNRKVRMMALTLAGIRPSAEEARLHHMIRAPHSIRSADELGAIENWLCKLSARFPEMEAKEVVASQWVRACIRAAPLGLKMHRAFRSSPLTKLAARRRAVNIDLLGLALLRLDYRSNLFSTLRRLGVSA